MKNKVYQMTLSALLIAIGILIPLISPIKILLEPASFTLGSHIAIMIAMFISPFSAAVVALGTTLGFFWAGFPIVVVARAASQIIFAVLGAYILKKNPSILHSPAKTTVFGLGISLIHALGEVLVVIPFYFGNTMSAGYYAKGFLISVVLLVGIGTLIHSMIDYGLSLLVWKPLSKTMRHPTIKEDTNVAK